MRRYDLDLSVKGKTASELKREHDTGQTGTGMSPPGTGVIMTAQLDQCMVGGPAERMPHCSLLASGLDVEPLVQLLADVDLPDEPWNDALLHRFGPDSDDRGRQFDYRMVRQLEFSKTELGPHVSAIPRVAGQRFVDACMDLIAPHVGRSTAGDVKVHTLGPGQEILPHRDPPNFAVFPDRYHLVIQGGVECYFGMGTQIIQHQTGDLWRLGDISTLPHWARNESKGDRVIAIIDLPSSISATTSRR